MNLPEIPEAARMTATVVDEAGDYALSIEPAFDSDGACAVQIDGFDVVYIERRTDGSFNVRVVAWTGGVDPDGDFTILPDVVVTLPTEA